MTIKNFCSDRDGLNTEVRNSNVKKFDEEVGKLLEINPFVNRWIDNVLKSIQRLNGLIGSKVSTGNKNVMYSVIPNPHKSVFECNGESHSIGFLMGETLDRDNFKSFNVNRFTFINQGIDVNNRKEYYGEIACQITSGEFIFENSFCFGGRRKKVSFDFEDISYFTLIVKNQFCQRSFIKGILRSFHKYITEQSMVLNGVTSDTFSRYLVKDMQNIKNLLYSLLDITICIETEHQLQPIIFSSLYRRGYKAVQSSKGFDNGFYNINNFIVNMIKNSDLYNDVKKGLCSEINGDILDNVLDNFNEKSLDEAFYTGYQWFYENSFELLNIMETLISKQ